MIIPMFTANENSASYGITHTSAFVYKAPGSSFPTRIKIWSNVNRPNPHPGEKRWTDFGSIGGNGKYLDPENQGTDDEITVLLSTESVAICRDTRMNTGQAMSGQVYAPAPALTDGETIELIAEDGTVLTGTLRLNRGSRGYGHIELA